jgi:flagellar hook-associated protein 3 FlgL
LNNLLGTLAELGAKDERLSTVASRIAWELPELQHMEAAETGLDLAGAITDLKMLEYSHKAALQTAGRILQPTLLDYLR